MYRHVLVPIDLSHGDVGARILGIAHRLVGETGRITVLSVLEALPAYVANYIPASVADKSREEAREQLAALVQSAGVEAEVRLRTGNAANEIIEEAREARCDAIIIGSHRPDYRDYFIGSTAARVVRHAPCSVIVERGSVTT
jgi:universal stress protein F